MMYLQTNDHKPSPSASLLSTSKLKLDAQTTQLPRINILGKNVMVKEVGYF
jgi:hypothetical protein